MCGIFGIFGAKHAEKYAFFGIYALQHRGQESVGIAVSDTENLKVVKKAGLVLSAIKKEDLEQAKGYLAIAHVRYATAGRSGVFNAQPFLKKTPLGEVAVVHNGNLVNFKELREELAQEGESFGYDSDTELFLSLLGKGTYTPKDLKLHPEDEHILPYFFYVLKRVKGAYSLLFLLKDRLIAVRDPYGFRPLLMGRLKDAILFASESCAFDILLGELWREIRPGEMVVVSKSGMRSYFPLSSPKKAMCIFEFVYFAKPESYIFNQWVYNIRKKMGELLAEEDHTEADVVVPVLDSGLVPALGYSQKKGIPLELGLIRNHYVGRSFIEPTQELRDVKVLMKLNPNAAVLKNKKVVVIDDSLVRGTTSKKIVSMLKRVGAKEVHMRIASPPVIGPCYYGIDTPTKEELIANKFSIQEIANFIGADSLRYLSLEGLKSCVENPEDFCTACFSDQYPLEVPQEVQRIRNA